MGRRSARAARLDRAVRHSAWATPLVRAGLAAYGLVHVLLAWVAVRLTFTHGGGAATGTGALATLAQGRVGRWSVGVMSAAFCALVLWQLVAMAVGYRQESGWWRRLMRAGAGCRAAVYAYFAWASGGIAVRGPALPHQSPRSATARVLEAPAGPVLLVGVGATVVVIGVALAVFGWRLEFLSQLEPEARDSGRRRPIVALGWFGYVAKGLAFAVIGVLVAWASVAHDPSKTGGLDQSLYLLLGGTAGRIAVLVVGGGIGCFGLYLFARARHLDTDRLTS